MHSKCNGIGLHGMVEKTVKPKQLEGSPLLAMVLNSKLVVISVVCKISAEVFHTAARLYVEHRNIKSPMNTIAKLYFGCCSRGQDKTLPWRKTTVSLHVQMQVNVTGHVHGIKSCTWVPDKFIQSSALP